MSERDYVDYLQDIVESIGDIAAFIEGILPEEFKRDKKTVNAVLRSIEVMGEAARHVPEEIREMNPQVPWKKMCGMRDKLIHEYHGVDIDTVWRTINEDIPPLRALIEEIINIEAG